MTGNFLIITDLFYTQVQDYIGTSTWLAGNEERRDDTKELGLGTWHTLEIDFSAVSVSYAL